MISLILFVLTVVGKFSDYNPFHLICLMSLVYASINLSQNLIMVKEERKTVTIRESTLDIYESYKPSLTNKPEMQDTVMVTNKVKRRRKYWKPLHKKQT